ICLFISLSATGFSQSIDAKSCYPASYSQEFPFEDPSSATFLTDFTQDTFLAALDSDENPREVIEVLEFDDDENRKKCVLPVHDQFSEEIGKSSYPGLLNQKKSNPLYILYCSLRIHLV